MGTGEEFTLPSGAKLYVSVSSFGNVKTLHDAVLGEMRGKGVEDLDLEQLEKAVKGKDTAGLGLFLDKIMSIVISKPVENAIFACAEKALYRHNGSIESSVQVTRALFDDPKIMEKAREDFYAICMNIARINLQPFIKALSSALSAHVAKSASVQK